MEKTLVLAFKGRVTVPIELQAPVPDGKGNVIVWIKAGRPVVALLEVEPEETATEERA